MHALVAARLGDIGLALRYLRETAAIDLSPDADAPAAFTSPHLAGCGRPS